MSQPETTPVADPNVEDETTTKLPEQRDSPEENLVAAVGRICWEIRERLGSGARAELRRERRGPAFWKLALSHLEPRGLLPSPDDPLHDEIEERWGTILAMLAYLADFHRPRWRLGRALNEHRFSEARLMRLVEAEGKTLGRLALRTARRLAVERAAVDAAELASLLLSDRALPRTKRLAKHEPVRRQIALDFFRSERIRHAARTSS